MLLIRGPSGSGKTTLLQLMGALKTPDRGRVVICGEPTAGLGQRQLRALRLSRIGFVFQFFNLFPTLSAWENVALPLDLVGRSRKAAEDRARELLAGLGLSDRADHRPSQLSGGQRQRVAVARALAANPAVILADEPTAALDGASGMMVVDTLRTLAHREGRIVVLVSHDQRLMEKADREIVVEDGRIVSERTAPAPSAPREMA